MKWVVGFWSRLEQILIVNLEEAATSDREPKLVLSKSLHTMVRMGHHTVTFLKEVGFFRFSTFPPPWPQVQETLNEIMLRSGRKSHWDTNNVCSFFDISQGLRQGWPTQKPNTNYSSIMTYCPHVQQIKKGNTDTHHLWSTSVSWGVPGPILPLQPRLSKIIQHTNQESDRTFLEMKAYICYSDLRNVAWGHSNSLTIDPLICSETLRAPTFNHCMSIHN